MVRIGLGLGAAAALRTLLSGVGSVEVARTCATLLLRHAENEPKSPLYFRLLTALCRAPGGGPNRYGQAAVLAELLAQPRRSVRVLLTLREAHSSPRSRWEADDEAVREHLGTPAVGVSWIGEPHPYTIFACTTDIPIEALGLSLNAVEGDEHAAARRAVGLTLEAQLRLVAATCAGPSGAGAAAAVGELLPFELCLGCARSQGLPARLRAAFLLVLESCHIQHMPPEYIQVSLAPNPYFDRPGTYSPPAASDEMICREPAVTQAGRPPHMLARELVRLEVLRQTLQQYTGHAERHLAVMTLRLGRAIEQVTVANGMRPTVMLVNKTMSSNRRGGESTEGRGAESDGEQELLRLVILLLRRHGVHESGEAFASGGDQTQSRRDGELLPHDEGNGSDEFDDDPYSDVAGEACALALVLLRELDSADLARLVAALREVFVSGTASGTAASEADIAAPRALKAVLSNGMGCLSDVATQQRLIQLLAQPSTLWNVQAGALRLLAWAHSRHVRLLGRIGRLQLADTNTDHLLARVAPRLAALRAATAAAGRWHFLCEPDHYQTLKTARGVLRDLAGLAGDGMAAQSVLVESGAVAALMQAVLLPATPASNGAAEMSQAAQLVAVARLACHALVALCHGCEGAQTELFAHLTRLSTPMWLEQRALELLEAVSDGRADLCTRMPAPLLRALSAAALGPTRSVAHARVLARLMVIHGVPIRRVQRRVVVYAASMPAAFALPEAGARAADEDGLVARFQLLSACAVGRHLETEAKCQQVCPLHALANALPGSPLPLRLAIAQLLHAAFIDTETLTPGLDTSQAFLRVLSHFRHEIDQLAEAEAGGLCRTSAAEQALDEKRKLIYDGVLPCLLSYLRGAALSVRGTVARLPLGQHAAGLGLSSTLLALYRAEAPTPARFA